MPLSRRPFDSAAFRRKFHYAGGDLGATWSPSDTRFRVWAPTARAVLLHLYRAGHGGFATDSYYMKGDRAGTWTANLHGNEDGTYYTFQALVDGVLQPEAVDPYAVAVGANGRRGMVLDLRRTDPAGWSRDRRIACASSRSTRGPVSATKENSSRSPNAARATGRATRRDSTTCANSA
jgi:pullulanase